MAGQHCPDNRPNRNDYHNSGKNHQARRPASVPWNASVKQPEDRDHQKKHQRYDRQLIPVVDVFCGCSHLSS
jgi:hypothetical protein